MRIVADTNRIIAALLKDGTTREILSDENFEFMTPDFTITEIEEHKSELQKIAKMADGEFKIHLALVFSYIKIIPEQDYRNFIDGCKNDISDPDDVPILAAAIASGADAIWAHDPHFNEQKKVRVLTNIDMLKLSGKSSKV
ncbi:MAG: hypothetical protein HY517_04635 [Candidatus Aenigmarchaeota archaeon]|nr:hypothetical protein [Candidatus Aenigmarchaeota archaeon]